MPAIGFDTKTFWLLVSLLNYGAAALCMVSVLRRPREPRAMMAWMLALLLLPVLAPLAYLLIGQLRLERTRRRRHRRRAAIAPGLARKNEVLRDVHASHEAMRIDPALRDLVRVATRLSAHPPVRGNDVTLFHDAEPMFLALQMALTAARSHIHMQYYIFQPDDTGRVIRDVLTAKRREGVEVRLLLDFVGCWRLPSRFLRPLREAGAEVAFFLPVIPWRGRWHVNFRNHRKNVVIDGEVGFTGSHNIGDEYRGRLKKLAPWRDTTLRVVGPAVLQLQETFAEDWCFTTKKELTADGYFPLRREAADRVVQVIPTGPDHQADVMHQVLFAGIAAAEKSICVITPYFVPDTAMMLAFSSACYRGVRVQLLIPSRTDNWLALWAGRSYYEELAKAGLEIHEYELGMLHSKVCIIDESWAFVGSANMDARSFRLNFELTSILYERELAEELQRDFNSLLQSARRIKPTGRRDWTFRESLSLGAARMVSPLL